MLASAVCNNNNNDNQYDSDNNIITVRALILTILSLLLMMFLQPLLISIHLKEIFLVLDYFLVLGLHDREFIS